MPYLHIRLTSPKDVPASSEVAQTLTQLTAKLLGKKQELTAITVERVPPDQWFVGGASVAATQQATFYFEVKITEGTNTKAEKSAYVQQVFNALVHLLGPLSAASYIVISEVRADSWGYQGLTQEFRYIKR